MHKILVTGGTGYIGSHTVVELIETGYEVLIIAVSDVARAHTKAVEKLFELNNEQGWYDVFNIGTGEGYSVLNMVNAFAEATGIKINYKPVPRRSGDVEAVYADTAKANRELNWQTQHTLTDMMRSAWEWEQSFKANPIK